MRFHFGDQMEKTRSDFFLKQAEMCRQAAKSARTAELGKQYLILAEHWLTLRTQAAALEKEQLQSGKTVPASEKSNPESQEE